MVYEEIRGAKVTSSTSVKLTKNQTLYSRWEKGGYITSKLNGGVNHASNPSKYYSAKAVTLKNPSRKGYSFSGWYTSKKLSEKSKITKISKGSKGNKTVYAKWTAKTYKITYDLDKGTNSAFTKKSGHVVTTKTYQGTSYTATVTGYKTEW